MAAIERLDFLGVPTQDPERSRTFYRDVLGLRPDEHADWEQWAGDTCFAIWEPEKRACRSPPSKATRGRWAATTSPRRARRSRPGRPVLRRHLRHGRLPHGDLRRPRRQPAHAAAGTHRTSRAHGEGNLHRRQAAASCASRPDRVIFPATERTPELTKLDVVEYYVAVEDGIMRALRQRPTTLERWPKGVHEGLVLATRDDPRGGDAFFQARPEGGARLPRDGADRVPLQAHRGRGLPDGDRGRRVVRADGDDHVPPVAGAQRRRRPPRRAAAGPRSAAGHRLRRRRARSATARELLADLNYAAFPKTSGGRGIHIYVRIEPKWTFTDMRHAAIGFGRELERRLPGGHDEVVEGGAR